MLVCGLIAIPIGVATYYALYRESRKATESLNQAFKNMRYNFDTGLLYLEHRARINGAALGCSQLKVTHFTHHDATIEYNSATVGGVTVGGVNVNPAYMTQKESYTDKFVLTFTDGLREAEVIEIVLTPELIRIAKQTPMIKERLTSDGHILMRNSANLKYELQASQLSSALGRDDFALNAHSQNQAARGLSREDVLTIRNWIAGC